SSITSRHGWFMAPMSIRGFLHVVILYAEMNSGFDIQAEIARELAVAPGQVRSTVELLQEGATVPFIARYRKERTGSLDETQIRQIEERGRYYGELAERQEAVLASIGEPGKLTDGLRRRIVA